MSREWGREWAQPGFVVGIDEDDEDTVETVVGVDLAREGERDQAAEVTVDRSGSVLSGDALAGARLLLLVDLWNRWAQAQSEPSGQFPGPGTASLARGALDLVALLGAVVSGDKVLLPRRTVLDQFVAATFPEDLRGWLWNFITREAT